METPVAPLRPSWFQAVFAFLIMLINAAIVSLALVAITDNFRDFLPGYIAAVLALVMMNCQYLGMFRFSRACTTFILWPLAIAFVFSCAFLFSSIQWIETAQSILVLVPVGVLVLLSVITGFGFRANWLWRKSLMTAKEQGTLRERETSFTLLEMMVGTLLLAVMIGPACYYAGAKYPIYRKDVSADQVPFPVPKTAQNITYRQEQDGTRMIRAIWYQSEIDLLEWLDLLEDNPDVVNFAWDNYSHRNLDVEIPQAPSLYGKHWDDKSLSRGFEVKWNYDDRRVLLIWDAEPQSSLTTVYYYEVSAP